MNISRLNLFLNKIFIACDKSTDKANNLCANLDKYVITDLIRIDNFASDNKLTLEQAKTVLDTLCEMQIMKKTERVYRCSNCNKLIRILTTWDEGDDFICDNCNTVHPCVSVFDTETIYSLHVAPTLKLFTVEWLDKFEKDSNDNPLPRKAEVIGYTQADAESVIHEYYHYEPNSITVSAGLEIDNKMLLKEYN